jgi:hypothetical protein
MANASTTSKDYVVTRIFRRLVWFLVMGLWMGLHLFVAVMVVLVSGLGRVVRWAGGWRTDLGMGMEYEIVERKEKTERLWPLEDKSFDEL